MDPPNLSQEVVSLINRIHLIPDESMENRARSIRGTRLEILKINGEVLNETILVPKGDPEKPLTRWNIVEKLKACATGQADETVIKRLLEAIEDMEGKAEFKNPMIAMRGAQ